MCNKYLIFVCNVILVVYKFNIKNDEVICKKYNQTWENEDISIDNLPLYLF